MLGREEVFFQHGGKLCLARGSGLFGVADREHQPFFGNSSARSGRPTPSPENGTESVKASNKQTVEQILPATYSYFRGPSQRATLSSGAAVWDFSGTHGFNPPPGGARPRPLSGSRRRSPNKIVIPKKVKRHKFSLSFLLA